MSVPKKNAASKQDKRPAARAKTSVEIEKALEDVLTSSSEQEEISNQNPEPRELGYLQPCMERRFHRLVQEKFEKLTGLASHEYWTHSDAGGAPKMEGEENRAKYAYDHGARHMGWSAHGAGCGGFKPPFHPHEAGDEEIRTALRATLMKKIFLYPEAKHYAIFVTEDAKGRPVIRWRGPIGGSK